MSNDVHDILVKYLTEARDNGWEYQDMDTLAEKMAEELKVKFWYGIGLRSVDRDEPHWKYIRNENEMRDFIQGLIDNDFKPEAIRTYRRVTLGGDWEEFALDR